MKNHRMMEESIWKHDRSKRCTYRLVWQGRLLGINHMEKMMNTKTEGNTFTKKIGQTVYVVRYHFNENAKETMQEKINRMLVTEASQQAVY